MVNLKQIMSDISVFQEQSLKVFDLLKLLELIQWIIDKSGIENFFLSLFAKNQTAGRSLSRLIYAHSRNRRISLPKEGIPFPTHELVPASVFKSGKRFFMTAHILRYNLDEHGFVLFKSDPVYLEIIKQVYPVEESPSYTLIYIDLAKWDDIHSFLDIQNALLE